LSHKHNDLTLSPLTVVGVLLLIFRGGISASHFTYLEVHIK